MGSGVQFDGLAEVVWKSGSETAGSVPGRSGSTAAAIGAMHTAGIRADAWVGDARPGKRMRGTETRARRCVRITVTTSVITGPGNPSGG
jgi:hypothetical protein